MNRVRKILHWINPLRLSYRVACFAGDRFMGFYLNLKPHSDIETVIFACVAVLLFGFAYYVNTLP